EPRGGGGAVPQPEDDRVPPRTDLPQARRPRPRAARPADGHGAARGRARPRGPGRSAGLVELLFEAGRVVARLLGRRTRGGEVAPGLVGLLTRVVGGGHRVLQPLHRPLGRALGALQLALPRAALGARLAQLRLELLAALAGL